MKKAIFLIVSLAIMIQLAGCGSQNQFTNSLTFGTGIGGNGFSLVGESTSFSLKALAGNPIYFRLESEADVDGRFLRLYFNDIYNKDYTLPQSYGHITLSSFPITNTGTYVIKAYYVKTVIDIGQETWITTSTITVTQ
ncbi:MAG: hypothetical protein WC889_06560 [Myxococcota bacterium]|jgi:hypothetical protein